MEQHDIFVVESRLAGVPGWRIYDAQKAKSTALKSCASAKKAWPEDEWRVVRFVSAETVSEGKP